MTDETRTTAPIPPLYGRGLNRRAGGFAEIVVGGKGYTASQIAEAVRLLHARDDLRSAARKALAALDLGETETAKSILREKV